MPIVEKRLTGVQRAAIILGILGEQHAAEIMKLMEPRELQLVGGVMATMTGVSKDDVKQVLTEFFEMMERHALLGIGSVDYIKNALVKALGIDKALALLERIKLGDGGPIGIDALRGKDPRVIADMLRVEHAQIIAIVLAHLHPEHAAQVLGLLPDAVRHDVLLRIATLEGVPEAAMDELDRLIEEQFSGSQIIGSSAIGGPKTAANILNLLDGSLESQIMRKVKEFDPELGHQIEELMFVFDNLLDVDDRSIQSLLREVSSQSLTLALKGADDAVKEKIFRNMSKRAAEMLRDDLEVMGPVRLSEVEAAQKEVLATARRMAESGDLVLTGKGSDRYV
jgi:flagellar motor switch protein FliG